MKILALMTVKNEADIIQYAVEDALRWADHIVILDNGSTDGTTQLVKELSGKYVQVLFWGIYGGQFHDWLRSLIFNDYKDLVQPGDWICRLDADEFYIDDPKTFLNNIPSDFDTVYSASFQYYFTDKDLDTDLMLPAQQRMKYFLCNHSECRFVKLSKNYFWPLTRNWPVGLSKTADTRIRLKHFQYRTKEQMSRRFEDRDIVNKNQTNKNLFMHEFKNNKVFDHASLTYDEGRYEYSANNIPVIPEKSFVKKIANGLLTKLFNLNIIRKTIYPSSIRLK